MHARGGWSAGGRATDGEGGRALKEKILATLDTKTHCWIHARVVAKTPDLPRTISTVRVNNGRARCRSRWMTLWTWHVLFSCTLGGLEALMSMARRKRFISKRVLKIPPVKGTVGAMWIIKQLEAASILCLC